MLINEAFPSTYLKAADLQGRTIVVKIDRVETEDLNGERKLAMYFVGKDKPMILNKTNANTIAAAYGQDTDDWRDAEVVLFMAMVDFQGKTVEALRVKIPPRKPVPRQQDRRDAPPPRRDRDTRDEMRDRDNEPSRDDMEGRGGAPVRPMASADIDDDIPFAPEWR